MTAEEKYALLYDFVFEDIPVMTHERILQRTEQLKDEIHE